MATSPSKSSQFYYPQEPTLPTLTNEQYQELHQKVDDAIAAYNEKKKRTR